MLRWWPTSDWSSFPPRCRDPREQQSLLHTIQCSKNSTTDIRQGPPRRTRPVLSGGFNDGVGSVPGKMRPARVVSSTPQHVSWIDHVLNPRLSIYK
eukprot:9432342-Pyramimonas_sp.AAC.1